MTVQTYKKPFFIISILFILTIACNFTKHYSEDPFYSYAGAWDSIRFPLIKPYEVINIGNGWGMDLYQTFTPKGIRWYLGIGDVEKISVAHGVIVVYTQDKPFVDVGAGEKVLYWFVIIPAKNIETGFESEEDLLNYLQEKNINQPNWDDPDSLMKTFQDTGCLEWIPDCN